MIGGKSEHYKGFFIRIYWRLLWRKAEKLALRERNFGSREESEVAGLFIFSYIRMMGYFRLMIAPQG